MVMRSTPRYIVTSRRACEFCFADLTVSRGPPTKETDRSPSLTTSRNSLLSVKRIRSALVLLCLLAFSFVSVVHAAHHMGLQSQAVSVAAAASPCDDANDCADAPAGVAEMCLFCALASAPIELFVFAAPARMTVDVASVSHASRPVGSSIEAPPPRA